MSRIKKRRGNTYQVLFEDTGPSKQERLDDPESYESRKRAALAKKKKPKSVYQKVLEEEKAAKDRKANNGPKGPLADKIRKLNAKKKQSD
ncbi:MAG: hypothetical protein ACPGF7_05820 [Pontibacterium sp.]